MTATIFDFHSMSLFSSKDAEGHSNILKTAEITPAGFTTLNMYILLKYAKNGMLAKYFRHTRPLE